MKRISMIFLLVLTFLMCASSVWSAPMELKWELSEEQRDYNDAKGRYKVYTIPKGWQFEVKAKNFTAEQGFKLPLKALYLFHYETEAEILSLVGVTNTGIYMGSGDFALYFEINNEDTQLRCWSGDKINFISRGKLPQKLVPPATIKMTYDVETGEIAGFINGVPAVSGNSKKMTNLPNISSISYTGVFVGSMWNSSWAKGVYKSISFAGK